MKLRTTHFCDPEPTDDQIGGIELAHPAWQARQVKPDYKNFLITPDPTEDTPYQKSPPTLQ